jgi:hypothetical protein
LNAAGGRRLGLSAEPEGASEEQRAELEKVARSRRSPQAVAQRAPIVLMTPDAVGPGVDGPFEGGRVHQ